ncbi:MAG: hypothetical protein WCK07_03025 [Betaproteobacteria bacterium]
MTEFLFVILTVVYAVVAIKVDQWSTISYLGFKTETPQLFLSNPSLYHRTRILLFSATVAALFLAHAIPWYLGAAGLAGVWLGAFWIGRSLGLSDFRRIHREMIEYDNDLKVSDPDEYARQVAEDGQASRLAELEKGARITNQELLERIERHHKWGI